MDEALSVREFWFGNEPLSSESLHEAMRVWFRPDSRLMKERDATIRARFGALLQRAAEGELAGWATSPRRRLSLIILLDQFPRHIFRGTARAFAYDEQALSLALTGMQSAADGALNVAERIFFYIPLVHSESLEVQDESVAAYRRLLAETPQSLRAAAEGALQSAESHRDVIKRFGRFPQRNRMLGRESTPDEQTYLREVGTGFGP
jgi:uncharacterized protein (DUF924 family)